MLIICEIHQSSWSIFRSKIGHAIIWRSISTFFLKTRKIRIIESVWIAFYVIWLYGYIRWKPPVIMVSFSVKNWSCHNLKVISTFFLKTRKIRIIESVWIAFYVIWLYGYIRWKPPVIMVSFSVKNWSCHNLKVNFDIFFKNSKNTHNRIYLNSFLCNLIIWLNSVKTMWHHGLFFGPKLVMP